ncbi:MAG: hypothetical protein JO202_06690 [Ktedonobacteraceae bacterium]|nr:hypothetical protein [Ktedonobacteraceae bacterium]
MKTCTFCQRGASDDSKFCGQCGRRLIGPDTPSTGNSVTRSSGEHVSQTLGTSATGDTTFRPSKSEENKDEDLEHEILRPFDDLDAEHATTIASDESKEGEDEEEVLVPFPPLWENAATQPLGDVVAQPPLHIDQVPYEKVPNIPAQPPQPAQLYQVAPPPSVVSPSPVAAPPPHVSATTRRPPHYPRHHIRPTCLVIVALGVIATSVVGGLIFAFFPKPVPPGTPSAKLVGEPILGQKMILHGDKFMPGETVIVAIDNKPLALNQSSSFTTMSIAGLFFQHAAQAPLGGTKEIVLADGTFSVSIPVDPSWPIGSVHTVYVYKPDGTLVKNLSFVVMASPTASTGLKGCLGEAGPITLGPVSEGSNKPVSKTVALCTEGAGPVNWTAKWDQKWLQLPSSGGIPAPEQATVTMSGSANGLKPGNYKTTVLFTSKQSTTRVPLNVVLVVVKAGPTGTTNRHVDCVSASPPLVSFDDVAGNANLLSRNVTVNNCGDRGTWSASLSTRDGKSWLGMDVSQGTLDNGGAQDIAVTVSSAALTPGAYTGQIQLTIGSSSINVDVRFTVRSAQKSPPPCLNVSPQQGLTYIGTAGQTDLLSKPLVLVNCGTAGHWSISTVTDDGANWIHLGLNSHELNARDTQRVAVSVSSAQLTSGTYTGRLIVALGSFSVRVNVTFIVRDSCLKVTYPSFSFSSNGGQSPLQNVEILHNCGDTGTWYGAVSTDDGGNWLTLNRTSDQLAANRTESLTLTVSDAQLQEGIHTGRILFIMGRSRQIVQVTFTIAHLRSCFSVNTNALTFTTVQGRNPDEQDLLIWNCGNTLDVWTASVDVPWLHTNLSQGSLKSGDSPQFVHVTLSSADLPSGPYQGHITFSAGPIVRGVQINLMVQPRPACIIADRTSLAFTRMANTSTASSSLVHTPVEELSQSSGSRSANVLRLSTVSNGEPIGLSLSPLAYQLSNRRVSIAQVKVMNCGGAGTLSINTTTDDGAPWLSAALDHENLDVIRPTSVASISVSANLTVGTYTGTVQFVMKTDAGAEATASVEVILTVLPPPTSSNCQAIPSTLSFTSMWGQPSPSAQNVTLKDCSGNDDWEESDGSNGLFNLNVYDGILDNTGSQVISVSPGSAPNPGQYTYTLTFTTGAGQMVLVNATWNITAPPNPACIQASSSSLSFDQYDDSSVGIDFTNCGADTGSIAVTGSTSDGANWLVIQPGGDYPIDGSGSYPTGHGLTASVNVNRTNLAPGQYNGSVKATIATGQSSQSVTVNITLSVPTPVTQPTPVPTDTPPPTPTDTPTPSPTDTPTPTPTATSTDTPTPTPTATSTDTPTPTPTDTPTPSPTDTPTPTPTSTS